MSTPPPGQNPYFPPPGRGADGGYPQQGPGPYQQGPGPYQGQPGPYQQGPGPYQGQPGPYQQGPGPYQGQPAHWGAPPPPPPPGNNRTALIVVASLVAVIAVVAVVLGLTLSGGSDTPSASAAGSSSATASTGAGAPAATTTDAAPAGGDVSVDVNPGDCIRLSGTAEDANAQPETCGSREANYKVVSKVATQDLCPTDVDSTYFETEFLGSGESGALCLDVDWVPGDCFEVPQGEDDDPQRVDCTAADPAKDTVKVMKILQNTSNEEDCDVVGYTYDERKVTVCLEDVEAG